MAQFVLPTPRNGYPIDTIRVALDGVTYTFAWAWNQTEGVWYVSIGDADADPIVSGLRVVLNSSLLASVADARRPPGVLLVLDPSGGKADPTLETLGSSVKVVYLDAAEVGS
jgi:hypothetical protein